MWDKVNTMPTFGDCELAWTNVERNSVKKYTVVWNGLIGKEKERWHPTQKPEKLMGYIIRDYTKQGELVADFFLGSGTTVSVAKQMKRNFIGVEREQKYVDIANERLRVLDLQPQLF